MPANRSALSYDVFVAPEKPFDAPPPAVGDSPAWDPTTSTLIFGARDAVLVDPLMTVREGAALADWVALHGRRLTTIYITHGHGDHYLGLPVVLDRFPDARAVATSGTLRQVQQAATQSLDDSLRSRFPGQIADTIPLPEPLDSPQLQLEDFPIQVIETGHTDGLDTTALHVPDLGPDRLWRRRLQPLPHVRRRDDAGEPGRMDRRARPAGGAGARCRRRGAQGPNPGQSARRPCSVPRLP